MYFASPVKHSQIVMRHFRAKSLQYMFVQTKKEGSYQYFGKCKRGTLLLFLLTGTRNNEERNGVKLVWFKLVDMTSLFMSQDHFPILTDQTNLLNYTYTIKTEKF